MCRRELATLCQGEPAKEHSVCQPNALDALTAHCKAVCSDSAPFITLPSVETLNFLADAAGKFGKEGQKQQAVTALEFMTRKASVEAPQSWRMLFSQPLAWCYDRLWECSFRTL